MKLHEDNLAYVPILTPEGAEGGRLYYIPHDADLYRRCLNAQEQLKTLMAPLVTVSITDNGRGADERSEAVVKGIEDAFEGLIDFACGVETSSETFKRFKPFAYLSDGTFWAASVIIALCAVGDIVMENTAKLTRTMKRR